MPIAYWCILVAALLPIAFVSYAKAGSGGDNRHPRDGVDALPPPQRRAYAAHQNGYENFSFFAAAVIVAYTMGGPSMMLNGLAVAYVVLRVLHGVLYIADQSSLRSFAYLASLLVNIAIFVLPSFK